jgi:NAD(P)H dehydrogenase (quinone)
MNDQAPRPARVLVLYHSETGNTGLMAELVAEGARTVPDTEVRLLSITEASADDLLWCDGVAVGSPTCLGSIAWQMKRFLDELVEPCWPEIEGKIGCAFSSEGGLQGGGELTCLALLTTLMNYGLLTFGIPDYVAPGRTLHYGAVCPGRPRDDADREACRRLGRRLAEWVQTLILNRPERSPRLAAYDRRV